MTPIAFTSEPDCQVTSLRNGAVLTNTHECRVLPLAGMWTTTAKWSKGSVVLVVCLSRGAHHRKEGTSRKPGYGRFSRDTYWRDRMRRRPCRDNSGGSRP